MTQLLTLRAGGTALLVRLDDGLLPAVVHWGPDPGPVEAEDLLAAVEVPYVDSVVMMPPRVALLPQHSEGWLGRPGLTGSREGTAWSVAFDAVHHNSDRPDEPTLGQSLTSTAQDTASGLEVTTELEVTPEGLVRVRASVRNTGEATYSLEGPLPALPVPEEAGEVLDLTGRHVHERVPQRRPFDVGAWVREARSRRVWGVHLAWSGNQQHLAERAVAGTRLLRAGLQAPLLTVDTSVLIRLRGV